MSALIKSIPVTVATNFSPDFSFDVANPSKERGAVGAVLSLVRPSVTIDIPLVGTKTYEPYGPPSGVGMVVLILVGGLAFIGVLRVWRFLRGD